MSASSAPESWVTAAGGLPRTPFRWLPWPVDRIAAVPPGLRAESELATVSPGDYRAKGYMDAAEPGSKQRISPCKRRQQCNNPKNEEAGTHRRNYPDRQRAGGSQPRAI